uniref:Zinc finger RING-type eukaryotic domain-containing protein n=1 Tax=Salvator merianae TaxID=96440 RepID=A0A8D0BMG0_SALMN
MAVAEASSRYTMAEGAGASDAGRLDLLNRFTCPVCLEEFETPVRAPCVHVFCTPFQVQPWVSVPTAIKINSWQWEINTKNKCMCTIV